ncbi:MAG TPA: amidase [Casimicrobiaceae bacterium]|nr:amidase [Casimicrobiaceae bacterium]
MLHDLPFATLSDLSRRLASGEATSVALVQACLDNIAAQDAKLHAFVEVYRADALRNAREADAQRKHGAVRGPLHGLPIAVKDLFHLEGRQTTAGSKSWIGRLSRETAASLERLIDAGMIPLGKTHLVEFAYGTWGTNKPMGAPWNPWDRAVHRVAGGSSSGSAVAVASGMAPAALGTDTGGSVRIPAALCGLTGFKPTYGAIPVDGVVALSTTLDSIGPITRSVDDAILLFEAMAGRSLANVEGSRFVVTALSPEQFPAFIEPDIVATFERTITALRSQGAVVNVERVPFDFDALGTRNGRLIAIEAYAQHRDYIEDASYDIDPGVRARIVAAKSATAAEHRAALDERRREMQRFADWMREREALLTPMLPITARPLTDVDETQYPLATWSRAVNYLGACAISLPAGFSSTGLPIGMQFIAKADDDALLGAIGRRFQSTSDWHLRRPA